MRKRETNGQTLVEVVIAIALVGVTLTSMVIAATVGITSARLAKERAEARHLAENKLEEVRRTRDADPEAFFAAGSRTVGPVSMGSTNQYEVTTTYEDLVVGEKVEVTVEVVWQDGARNFSTIQSTYLNRWQ